MNDSKLNYKEIWENCLRHILINEDSKHTFESIIEKCEILSISHYKVILGLDNEFNKSILETQFYRQLKEAFELVLNSNLNLILITVDEYKKLQKEDSQEVNLIDEESKFNRNDSLNSEYTFENFVVSEKNKMLYSASLSISLLVNTKWNPLFIFGGSGLGKTHLLHAIGNQCWKNNPNKKIRYIESRDFSKLVHQAKQSLNSYEEFHKIQENFEKYDLLLVDDIQFIATQNKTKEIFFNIFNFFLNQKKQVVITCDQYPRDLGDFEERFISRFEFGLTLPINPPDFETSKKITLLKLKKNNFDISTISDEAIDYIAQNFSNNIRTLEGAIARIIFEKIQMTDEFVNLEKITDIFKDIVKNTKGTSVNKVINILTQYFGIAKPILLGNSRKENVVLARHFAIYFVKNKTKLSYKEVGKIFNRTHSSIIFSVAKIEKEIKSSTNISQIYVELVEKLK